MSADVAAAIRAAIRERQSLIVMAVPRLAGKSTVLHAALAERPRSSPVRTLAEDGDDVDELLRESKGGYFVIPEITRSGAMPGYIWGADVRRIFEGARDNVSLAATLHADGPDDAFSQICGGCGVADAEAAKITLAVHLRSLGRWEEPTRRVVQSLSRIDGVKDGRARVTTLFRWDEQSDRFV